MELDPQIADSIVTNLKDIIRHEINLFDTTGTIIASTDKSRVGTGHDGARQVIATKQTLSIDEEHSFKGARHGINVPVLFGESVVAVIGITGEREEVEPFGNVIKKMTEILLRESFDRVERYDRRERLSSLMNLLIARGHDGDLACYLASTLDIDLGVPRLAIVGRFSDSIIPIEGHNAFNEKFYIRFENVKDCLCSVTERGVRLFVPEHALKLVEPLLKATIESARTDLSRKMAFGTGRVEKNGSTYWRTYRDAARASEWMLFSEGEGVADYYDLDLGLLLSSAPDEEGRRFVERVLGGLSEAERDDADLLFAAYTKFNGSITRCADALFMHKNTLQNRLNRIGAKTGYNPRDLSDHAVLLAAFKLRRYLSFKGNRGPLPEQAPEA